MIYWIGFTVTFLLWLAIGEQLNKKRLYSKLHWELLVVMWIIWSLFYYVHNYSGWLPRVW